MTNKKRLGPTLPKHLYDELAAAAVYRGQTLNALGLEILWDWLTNNEATIRGGRKENA